MMGAPVPKPATERESLYGSRDWPFLTHQKEKATSLWGKQVNKTRETTWERNHRAEPSL